MSAALRLRLLPLLRRPLPRAPPPHLHHPRRHASTAPKTLAKPKKYTPPSHPSAPPRSRDPTNYPGPPQPARDPARRYPHTMPPPHTLAHTLLTSRTLHFYIAMGVLSALAATVSIRNFVATAPAAAGLRWQWARPVASARAFLDAVRAHAEDQSRRVAEMRRRKVEDVELRGEFRRAHGVESAGVLGGWSVKRSGREPGAPQQQQPKEEEAWVEGQIRRAEEEAAAAVHGTEREAAVGHGAEREAAAAETPARKKGWW